MRTHIGDRAGETREFGVNVNVGIGHKARQAVWPMYQQEDTMKKKERVVVYTAITGGYEEPKQMASWEGADFYLFSDQPKPCKPWNVLRATDLYKNPQRNARHHKLVPHEWFGSYDVWVWLDGSMRLLVPVQELLDRYPGDLVAFMHPDRDCLYDEAQECKMTRLGKPQVLDRQVTRYRAVGYPRHNGLAETKVVIRRHTPRVINFNKAWQYEIVNGSHRDQVSFNYAAWIRTQNVMYMPPDLYRGISMEPPTWRGPMFEYTKHEQKRY